MEAEYLLENLYKWLSVAIKDRRPLGKPLLYWNPDFKVMCTTPASPSKCDLVESTGPASPFTTRVHTSCPR
jgi:hypothetical protein